MGDRRRNGLRFLASLMLVAFPSAVGLLWLAGQFQRAYCPQGTFLTGSVEPGMQMIGLLITGMALTYFTARQIKARVEFFQGAEDDRYETLIPPYAYLIAFVAGAALFILGSASRFCAADSGIVYEDVANSVSKTFTWQDVTAVRTRCYYQSGKGGGWRQNLFVTMTDGTSLDLMGKEGEMPSIYPRIVTALGGHDFSFSANIAPRCDYSHLEMLTQRP